MIINVFCYSASVMVASSQTQSTNFEKKIATCVVHTQSYWHFCDGRRFCLTFTDTALDVVMALLIYILINRLLMVKFGAAVINTVMRSMLCINVHSSVVHICHSL